MSDGIDMTAQINIEIRNLLCCNDLQTFFAITDHVQSAYSDPLDPRHPARECRQQNKASTVAPVAEH